MIGCGGRSGRRGGRGFAVLAEQPPAGICSHRLDRGHRRQQRIALQLLKLEDRNRLRLAVFKKREVALLQIGNDLPGLDRAHSRR